MDIRWRMMDAEVIFGSMHFCISEICCRAVGASNLVNSRSKLYWEDMFKRDIENAVAKIRRICSE